MKVSIFALSILLACACALASAEVTIEFLGDSSSNLKDALSGLASASGSSVNVNNIISCGFSTLADKVVANIKDLVSEASSCNPAKISDISAKLKALMGSVPDSVKNCLATNSDAKTLFGGLHLTGKTADQIKTDVTNFVLGNPLTACRALQGLQSDIASGNMKKLGADAGALLIKIYSSKTLVNEDAVEFLRDSSSDLKDTLSGLASASGSSVNVNNIFNCGFSALADKLAASIKDLVSEASSCNPAKISDISAKLKALMGSVPDSAKNCLATNSDAKTLFSGLHITGKTADQIKTDVTNFVLGNPLTACHALQGLQSDIASGNMKKLGADAGALLLKIESSKTSAMDDYEMFAIAVILEMSA